MPVFDFRLLIVYSRTISYILIKVIDKRYSLHSRIEPDCISSFIIWIVILHCIWPPREDMLQADSREPFRPKIHLNVPKRLAQKFPIFREENRATIPIETASDRIASSIRATVFLRRQVISGLGWSDRIWSKCSIPVPVRHYEISAHHPHETHS